MKHNSSHKMWWQEFKVLVLTSVGLKRGKKTMLTKISSSADEKDLKT
jgi:hypothetical protein